MKQMSYDIIESSIEQNRMEEQFMHVEIEEQQRRAATLSHQLRFGEAEDATGAADAAHFLQQFGPVPGTHKTTATAQVDEVEEGVREFEHAQSIHDEELDLRLLRAGSLLTSVGHDAAADIDADEGLAVGVGACQVDEPAAGPAADVEHALEAQGVRLFRQHAAHGGGEQVISYLEALAFFAVEDCFD